MKLRIVLIGLVIAIGSATFWAQDEPPQLTVAQTTSQRPGRSHCPDSRPKPAAAHTRVQAAVSSENGDAA